MSKKPTVKVDRTLSLDDVIMVVYANIRRHVGKCRADSYLHTAKRKLQQEALTHDELYALTRKFVTLTIGD